tara:strand:+ start:17098 stop:18075 length:978 start_codon:yes stop_codon:yes gene_type:complete
MQYLVECENIELWHNFLEKEKNSQIVTIAHNPCLGGILSKTFGYSYKNYFIKNNEETIGVLPTVTIGKKIISMPHFSYGGPILKNSFSQNVDVSSLIKDSKYEFRSFTKLSNFANEKKLTFIVSLIETADEIFKGFSSRFRSKIRKSQRYGFTIKSGGIDMLDDFYLLYSKRMLQKGSPPLGKLFFKNLLEHYKNGKAEITTVYDKDKPVATGFCLSYLNFKEYCWGSTDNEYNRHNVNALLLWNLIKESDLEGYKYFSLGRSTRDSNNHDYKIQWNPMELPLYFNLSEASSGSIKDFGFLTKIWKHQPLKTSQILGHYVSKYVY